MALGATLPEGPAALPPPEASVRAEDIAESPACPSCQEVSQLDQARQMLGQTPAAAEPVLEALFRDAQSQDVAQGAAALLVEAGARDWPGGAQGQFLRTLAPLALLSGRAWGIPPSITLAQGILESGWGKSGLAREDNNLFGMKSGASTYRTYPGWQESVLDHAQTLASSSRYARARLHTDNWHAFLTEMAPVYATSHAYVSRVSGLVDVYGLDRWDALVHAAVQARARGDASGEIAQASPP